VAQSSFTLASPAVVLRSSLGPSNRALEELPSIFGDPLLSSAALDRLLDDAHVVVLEGDSYRNPPPDKRQAKRIARRSKETAP
jgi:DNA replication protein DnaC